MTQQVTLKKFVSQITEKDIMQGWERKPPPITLNDYNKMKNPNEKLNKKSTIEQVVPLHYSGTVQPIDLIEAQHLNFAKGSIIKYVCRAGRKEDELADLKKALFYLNLEIKKLENK